MEILLLPRYYRPINRPPSLYHLSALLHNNRKVVYDLIYDVSLHIQIRQQELGAVAYI